MKATLTLLALALPLTAAAQTPADTATFYKHHVGLTASPQLDKFFKANRSLPLGVLYKRQTAPNQALRLRVVGRYSRRDTTTISYLGGSGSKNLEFNFFVGYEWQKNLNQKFKFNYGIDTGVGISRKNTTVIEDKIDQIGEYRSTYSYISRVHILQIRPFAGLSCAISNYTSIFFESAAFIEYQRLRENRSSSTVYKSAPPVLNGSSGAYFNSNVWSAYYRPVQLVGLLFRF